MKTPKFGIVVTERHGRKRWRIRIPATLSNDGKTHDILYQTRAEADADRRALLDKYARGEFRKDEALTSAQVSEAQRAFAELARAGAGMSLVEAVREALRARQARLRGISVEELLKRYEDEVKEARRWSPKYVLAWNNYSRQHARQYAVRRHVFGRPILGLYFRT